MEAKEVVYEREFVLFIDKIYLILIRTWVLKISGGKGLKPKFSSELFFVCFLFNEM